MSGKESDYLSFYEKLKKISLLSDKRTHATKSLVDTYTYFTTPDTAVVNSIYDYYAKNIELTLSANSVFALEKLINLVQNPEFRQNYQSVEINELTRTASGYYRLNLTLFCRRVVGALRPACPEHHAELRERYRGRGGPCPRGLV